LAPVLEKPYSVLAWIQAFFGFETDVGKCPGIFRLVLQVEGLAARLKCLGVS
jgi:hypothetical protein